MALYGLKLIASLKLLILPILYLLLELVQVIFGLLFLSPFMPCIAFQLLKVHRLMLLLCTSILDDVVSCVR